MTSHEHQIFVSFLTTNTHTDWLSEIWKSGERKEVHP